MKLNFEEFKTEIDELIEFLTSETWEFFGTPNPKAERIRKSYENGFYTGDGTKTFWVMLEDGTKAGIIRIYDLEDGDPIFDIRILKKYHGKGIGTATVKWLTDYVFNNYPDKERMEASTRQDNYGMRCVFAKSGYLKEAIHRKAWPTNDGTVHNAVIYGVTREDWESGTVTPINWDDFKC